MRSARSPAYWYCALGLCLLALSFGAPIASARRTARAEARGGALAGLLLREAATMEPLPLEAGWARELVFARLVAAGAADGQFVADLELLDADGPTPAVTCRNKHYVFQLRATALPADAGAGDGSPALEVMAWPRSDAGPAHVVFFWPADAEPAYSRNLQEGYCGEQPEHWPRPGAAHRRPLGGDSGPSYRGNDDERWLLIDRPAARSSPP